MALTASTISASIGRGGGGFRVSAGGGSRCARPMTRCEWEWWDVVTAGCLPRRPFRRPAGVAVAAVCDPDRERLAARPRRSRRNSTTNLPSTSTCAK